MRLHQIISEGTVDEGPIGSYRKVDVRAGLHVCPSWRQVPQLTRGMLEWLNKSASELPAVFSSAILHLRFVEVHPFRDGNGRVGRALATWQLYRMGFDTLHVFALDVEREDLGGWLEFMAEAVLETLERVQKRVQGLGLSGKEPLSLTLRQEKLLRLLREREPMGIRDIARALRVTLPGAHYALKPLLRRSVIKTIGSHKSTRYLPA